MSTAPDDLTLYEEILLLALKDEEGTVAFGVMLSQALGGAILAELLLEGRLETTKDKSPKIKAVGRTPLGDPILDNALGLVRAAKKPIAATSSAASCSAACTWPFSGRTRRRRSSTASSTSPGARSALAFSS